MDIFKRSLVSISGFPTACLKIRPQVKSIRTSYQSHAKKKMHLDLSKDSITKGPKETVLKPSIKEHPALHGLSTNKHNVAAFENLGLRNDLCNALKALNIHQPTVIQLKAIQKILEGQSILCTSQTGSGKTLAYVLPIVHLLKTHEECEGITPRINRPRACIVLPFRELAVQVLGVIKFLCHFTKLRSLGLISGRKKKWIREGLSHPVDIVVATPQTLLKYHEKGKIYLSDLSHLVIDEADTMFDRSFKTTAVDILKCAGVTSASWEHKRHSVQTTFVTTTVPIDLLRTIDNIVPKIQVCSTDIHQVLPHLSQKFIKIPQHKKSELLVDILLRELHESTKQIMIFCNTTKSCDWTSYFLEEQGIPQIRLNGTMTKKERRLHLEKFHKMEAPVLICTDIASRGLDTTNVSHVINFDFPCTVGDYLHRAGRTGRLGYSSALQSQPQVTSFLSHNKELVITEQIKKAIQKRIPLEDATLWQNRWQKIYQKTYKKLQ